MRSHSLSSLSALSINSAVYNLPLIIVFNNVRYCKDIRTDLCLVLPFHLYQRLSQESNSDIECICLPCLYRVLLILYHSLFLLPNVCTTPPCNLCIRCNGCLYHSDIPHGLFLVFLCCVCNYSRLFRFPCSFLTAPFCLVWFG